MKIKDKYEHQNKLLEAFEKKPNGLCPICGEPTTIKYCETTVDGRLIGRPCADAFHVDRWMEE